MELDLSHDMKRHPGFEIHVTNTKDARSLQEWSGTGIFNMQKQTCCLRNIWGDTGEKTTCELILVGTLRDPIINTDAYFAVVPSHFSIAQGQLDAVVSQRDAVTIDIARNTVQGTASRVRYILHLENSGKRLGMKTISYPMFTYRHYQIDQEEEEYGKFVSDMSLLQLSSYPGSSSDTISESEILDAMRRKTEKPYASTKGCLDDHVVVKDNIFPLRNEETLSLMGRKKVIVFVGPATGYMIVPTTSPSTKPVGTEATRKFALRINFVLTSW